MGIINFNTGNDNEYKLTSHKDNFWRTTIVNSSDFFINYILEKTYVQYTSIKMFDPYGYFFKFKSLMKFK